MLIMTLMSELGKLNVTRNESHSIPLPLSRE
jgi:hypothetical protein